jgi:glycerol-3-phosphate dehydrogenase
MIAQGVPASEIRGRLGATAEAVDTVPQLARLCEKMRSDAPALLSLNALVEGTIQPSRWIEDVRTGGRAAA